MQRRIRGETMLVQTATRQFAQVSDQVAQMDGVVGLMDDLLRGPRPTIDDDAVRALRLAADDVESV